MKVVFLWMFKNVRAVIEAHPKFFITRTTLVGSAPENKIEDDRSKFPAGIFLINGWLSDAMCSYSLSKTKVKSVMLVLVLPHLLHVQSKDSRQSSNTMIFLACRRSGK